jgi:signal transduction histidine kinase
MILSKLNSITTRIAVAIILAVFLGLLMMLGLNRVTSPFLRNAEGDGSRTHFILSRSQVAVINAQRNPMMLSGRMVAIIRSLASSPPSERQKIVAAMTQPDLQVALDTAEHSDAADNEDEGLYRLRQLVQMQLEALSPPILVSARRLSTDSDGSAGTDRVDPRPADGGAIEAVLQDGQRIIFTIPDFPSGAGYGLFIFLISILFVAVVVSIWTARRLARPIREFARAAEQLGVDLTAQPLGVRGPQELRVTIQAFNRMQDRLRRFLEDRTQMLAAISHDLRAPLARSRLRAELVADGEQQRKMFDDLEDMNSMIDSTLAFARNDARREPRRLVDLGVLVGDLCEDAGDAGREVSYSGSRGIDVSCRPTDIRRAVANLVDNAIKYGGCVHVDVVRDVGCVTIVVEDNGPGIPPEEQEKVFAPFYRREPARDPAKAGVGLGLSIARTIAREHGGDVTLRNRDKGGLSVLIELPALPP